MEITKFCNQKLVIIQQLKQCIPSTLLITNISNVFKWTWNLKDLYIFKGSITNGNDCQCSELCPSISETKLLVKHFENWRPESSLFTNGYVKVSYK